jgi:hypothetical protein
MSTKNYQNLAHVITLNNFITLLQRNKLVMEPSYGLQFHVVPSFIVLTSIYV